MAKINVNIEAEGGELVLRNQNGGYAIIPRKYRYEVLDMLNSGCNDCLNDLISRLPKMENYAEDGTVVSLDVTENPEDDKKTKKNDSKITTEVKPLSTEDGIEKIITLENGFNLVVYNKNNITKTGGNVYVPKVFYDKLKNNYIDDDSIYFAAVNGRDSEIDYMESKYTYLLTSELIRIKNNAIAKVNNGQALSRVEAEILKPEFDKFLNQVMNSSTVQQKLSAYVNYSDALNDMFFDSNDANLFTPGTYDVLISLRDQIETYRIRNGLNSAISTTGSGPNSRALGLRSVALMIPTEREVVQIYESLNRSVPYNSDNPATKHNVLFKAMADVVYDTNSDDIYYDYTRFDIINDDYKKHKLQVKNTSFINTWAHHEIDVADKYFKRMANNRRKKLEINPYAYSPRSYIRRMQQQPVPMPNEQTRSTGTMQQQVRNVDNN